MSTHYTENASSGSQYYFNANNTSTTSQSYQPYGSSGYSTYPTSISGSRSPNQQIRIDNSYQTPQNYQSVAGFNRNVTQQRYQTPQSPSPQVRASVRIAGSQDQYSLPNSSQPIQISPQQQQHQYSLHNSSQPIHVSTQQPQYSLHTSSHPIQVSPQQHHFQFDSHQQPGHATGPAVVYQTPGAAQFTHRNVDLWTEGQSQGPDHHVQVLLKLILKSNKHFLFYTIGSTCISSICFNWFSSTISFNFSSTTSRSFTTIL
jgi:hypothetical protein